MAKKKQTQTPALQGGDAQVQQLLAQYHQIANNLRASKDRPQTETALVEINNAPEGVQIALLKQLPRENHVDAADVLLALNELSPLKSVRKEAKRSLIQLEGLKIHPRWQPPVEQSPVLGIALPSTNPPRFWKCLVTDSRDAGEVQLLCCWEQGDNYKEVRVLGFLLEFWSEGVKDFFSMVESKRGFERFVAEAAAAMSDAPMKDCSFAKARRLLREALDINEKRGILLPKDYRFNLSLINLLLLEAPDLGEESEEDEEREERGDLHNLSPEDVVITFLEAWTDDEDYETAYDLLSQDSPLRAGLSRDEWIEQRNEWAMQAAPYRLKLDFCYERQQPKPKQWLPHLFKTEPPVAHMHKEVEAGWSIELDKNLFSPDDAPSELPAALAVYKESGRHWFWSSYILVQENDDWRIQSMADEGTRTQELPADELRKKVREFEKFLEEAMRRHTPGEIRQQLQDKNMSDYYKEMVRRVKLVNCYVDVLDKKMQLNRSAYEEVADRMFAFGQYERSLTYLIPLAQRFPEQRATYLRRAATALLQLSEQYLDEDYDDEERADRCVDLAEEALREALQAENSFETRIDLAELLIGIEERLEEAEDHLQQARELISGPQDEAKIEHNLGEIANQRGQYKETLSHFQRVVELLPEESEAWADLAQTHQHLDNFEEAEANYKQAIAVEPREVYYFTLSELYKTNNQLAKALAVLEEGLAAHSDSALLHAYMAVTYLNNGDYSQAERYLDKAEEIDPELDVIPTYRSLIAISKLEQMQEQTSYKPGKPLKRKGRGRGK